MPLYALDAVDDAVGPTRQFVADLGIRDWVKLLVVVPFVGGLGSASFSANLPRRALGALPGSVPVPGSLAEVTVTASLAAALVAALVAGSLVRSLLEFVFYASLRTGEVRVRSTLRQRWRQGVQLWVVRSSLALVTLVGAATLVAFLRASEVTTAGVGTDVLVVVAVAAAVGTYAVLAGLTTRFVVPVMMVRDAGILAGWTRFLRTVAANPGQYVAYLGVGLFVRFVADVLALSAAVLLATLVSVPVVLVLVPSTLVVAAAPWTGLYPPFVMLAGGLTAAYVLAVLAGAVVVRAPFVAYVRYYALAVLRGTDPRLDLLAAR